MELALQLLVNCPLFKDLNPAELKECLSCAGASKSLIKKNNYLFNSGEEPKYLYILLQGSIAIGSYTANGKERIITIFQEPGTIFGEVFLFLDKQPYENFVQANTDSVVLKIPKDFLYKTCSNNCPEHQQILKNMLNILATKTYFLNQRVQILNSHSLRQKIARTLLLKSPDFKLEHLNREQLANFINATRPSVSRELLNMAKEGLITLNKKQIIIKDLQKIKDLC